MISLSIAISLYSYLNPDHKNSYKALVISLLILACVLLSMLFTWIKNKPNEQLFLVGGVEVWT